MFFEHPTTLKRDTGERVYNNEESSKLLDYRLSDRFSKQSGRVFLSGVEALLGIMLQQKRLDERDGINTAGFISGYRGSPVSALDKTAWSEAEQLKQSNIKFLPAINEELAATAVLGAQQVEFSESREVDGVFSMWYGKGPGVDRAADAIKHGNGYGSSEHGGVLVIAGDDHGGVSSTMSHQSDLSFIAAYMPVLNPASVSEYLEFGAFGFALSRYTGMWVGFKAISETVESSASVELADVPNFIIPTDIELPKSGLNYRWPDLPGMQIETRMLDKKNAARAFARANPIDRAIYNIKDARYGIVTTGKAYLDVLEALALLGIDEKKSREVGVDIYKIGMVWPLEHTGVERFMAGKDEVLVVEEKRGIIESELKEYLYDRAIDKPKLILGKHDEHGERLISWVEEISPSSLLPVLAKRLRKVYPMLNFDKQLNNLKTTQQEQFDGEKRTPFFCSGCPHNTSTKLPEGSKAS